MKVKALFIIFCVTVLLIGCSLWQSKDILQKNPGAYYQQGYDHFQKGRYEKAIESFQRLKEEYPLSELAIRAEIGIADAQFSREEYGYAEMAYNDFLNLHPTNENIPYVMYQIGMCHYKQLVSIDRDQTNTSQALNEFEKLKSRFPSSKFAYLAEKKIRDAKQQLAEHEYYVGELYFRMKKYNAALKRFEGIKKSYPNIGLDYKVDFIIEETKKLIVEATRH
jgi:outer membrane protein assembly factor BamD